MRTKIIAAVFAGALAATSASAITIGAPQASSGQVAYLMPAFEVGPGGIANSSKNIKLLKKCQYNVHLKKQKNPFAKGDSVLVEWKKMWFKATVLNVYGTQVGKQSFKIHYDGWSKSWDEKVGYNRILHLDKCEK